MAAVCQHQRLLLMWHTWRLPPIAILIWSAVYSCLTHRCGSIKLFNDTLDSLWNLICLSLFLSEIPHSSQSDLYFGLMITCTDEWSYRRTDSMPHSNWHSLLSVPRRCWGRGGETCRSQRGWETMLLPQAPTFHGYLKLHFWALTSPSFSWLPPLRRCQGSSCGRHSSSPATR